MGGETKETGGGVPTPTRTPPHRALLIHGSFFARYLIPLTFHSLPPHALSSSLAKPRDKEKKTAQQITRSDFPRRATKVVKKEKKNIERRPLGALSGISRYKSAILCGKLP